MLSSACAFVTQAFVFPGCLIRNVPLFVSFPISSFETVEMTDCRRQFFPSGSACSTRELHWTDERSSVSLQKQFERSRRKELYVLACLRIISSSMGLCFSLVLRPPCYLLTAARRHPSPRNQLALIIELDCDEGKNLIPVQLCEDPAPW